MNVQQRSFRDAVADKTTEPLIVDRGSFRQRTAMVAAAAEAEADDVDRGARFPQKAIDTARQHKLLGVQIPQQFGGDGAGPGLGRKNVPGWPNPRLRQCAVRLSAGA